MLDSLKMNLTITSMSITKNDLCFMKNASLTLIIITATNYPQENIG